MDPKELKSLLKQARTAFKENDYNTSVKLCKTILKAEPENYTALVCMGAALSAAGKGQQCVEAYKQAIAANASQIPAWQGLVKHYETNGIKNHPDLIEAYKRIATFYEKDPDETKYIENTMKFAGVLVSQGEFQKGLKVLMRLAKRMKLPVNVATLVVQIISNLKGVALTPEEELLHIEALDTLTKNSETAKDDYFKTFYSLLYKRGEVRRLVDECLAVPHLYNSIYYPLEYLCRLYVEDRPEVDYGREVSSLADKLFKLYPSSLWGYYAKGKFCFEFGRVRDSLQWLKEGLNSKFNKHAALVLIQAKLKSGDYSGALETIEEFMRNVKNTELEPTLEVKLRILKIEALMCTDIASAEKSLQELADEGKEEYTDEVVKLKAKLCIWKMDWSTLREIIAEVKESDPVLHFYGVLASSDGSAEEILKFCESEHADEDSLIMSGMILWKMDKLSEAGTVFNKVVRSNNNHPLPCLYLGKLHSLAGDLESAIKCYEISYELYPTNEAGSLLSDAYFEAGSGYEEKNKELLTAATKRLRKLNSKWAWLRLGLLSLQIGDVHQATVALQSAVRTDYNDGDLWETLADAYFARGSFQSALKSYNKALELNVDPIYTTYKIGILYQQLKEYPQAIKMFEDLLVKEDTYIPAILELAKTHFKKAQNYFADKRDSSGVQAVEECLKWATRCLELGNKALPWKIIGDCAVLMADLPASMTVKLPKFLMGPACEDDYRPVDVTQCLRIGTDCLHMALKVCKSAGLSLAQSELYHDLGNIYRLRAMKTVDLVQQKQLLQKALAAVKIAVSHQKTNHIYWNTLGVIASHKTLNLGPLAQHCFIKSLQLEPNNVVAWCNLGMLQYHSQSYINAHHCFSKAQSIDPSYSYCWVGQCIVAEKIRPMEAIDLYRHSCLLENYPDIATLGYTDWVCRLLASGSEKDEHYVYSIIKCEAVRTSFDLISHYCDRHPDDPFGFAYRGLLAGRLDLLHSAKLCFEKCLQLIAQNESKMIDVIKCNLAATLLNLGETDKSFEYLQEIEDADFVVCCVAAKAFDTAKNYEMCIHAYEQAVEKAPDNSAKAEALIGLGIVHGKFTGLEEAKTHIFQAWRLARDKITGLLAIVALSLQKEELTNADRVIANAVYEEIRTITDYDMLNDVATISSAWFLAEGNLNDARNCILRAARRYPWNPALWNTLAHFLIECHGKEAIVRPLIRKSVARASVWERTSELLVALSYLLEADVPHGLLYAKKAVHSEPYVPSTWAILILALYRQMGGVPCKKTLNYTLDIARKALTLCTDQFSSIAVWLREYAESVPQLL